MPWRGMEKNKEETSIPQNKAESTIAVFQIQLGVNLSSRVQLVSWVETKKSQFEISSIHLLRERNKCQNEHVSEMWNDRFQTHPAIKIAAIWKDLSN